MGNKKQEYLNKAKKFKKRFIPTFILFIIMTTGISIFGYAIWYTYTYQLEYPSRAHLLTAKYTNNIDIVVSETRKGMEYYEGYHGNVAIIYPRPQTEWDYYRTQINEVLEHLENIAKNTKKGDDAYDEALDAGKTSLFMYYNGEDNGSGLVDKFVGLLDDQLYKDYFIFLTIFTWSYIIDIILWSIFMVYWLWNRSEADYHFSY